MKKYFATNEDVRQAIFQAKKKYAPEKKDNLYNSSIRSDLIFEDDPFENSNFNPFHELICDNEVYTVFSFPVLAMYDHIFSVVANYREVDKYLNDIFIIGDTIFTKNYKIVYYETKDQFDLIKEKLNKKK